MRDAGSRINFPTLPTQVYVEKQPIWMRCQQVMRAMLVLQSKGIFNATIRDMAAEIDPRVTPAIWNNAVNVLVEYKLLLLSTPPNQKRSRRFQILGIERFKKILEALSQEEPDTSFEEVKGMVQLSARTQGNLPNMPTPPPEEYRYKPSWWKRMISADSRQISQVQEQLKAIDKKLDELLALWS